MRNQPGRIHNDGHRRRARACLLCLLCCAVAVSILVGGARGGQPKLIYRKNSLYHQILVYRDGPVVTLRFRKTATSGRQSEVDLSNPRRHCLEYTKLAFCSLLYRPEPENVLVVGLGGGTIPRDMHHYLPHARIDVVEIDAEVPRVAKKYFGFREHETLKVHVADGRVLIRRLLREEVENRYDIVILDAFTSDYIPFHLMTREFLKEVREILADDGVVVANVWSANRLYDAELKTFLDVYGGCQGFFGATSGNVLLVAFGPGAEPLTREKAAASAARLQHKHRFAFDMRTVARRLQVAPQPDAKARVLTDDRAPVHWLRAQPRDK